MHRIVGLDVLDAAKHAVDQANLTLRLRVSIYPSATFSNSCSGTEEYREAHCGSRHLVLSDKSSGCSSEPMSMQPNANRLRWHVSQAAFVHADQRPHSAPQCNVMAVVPSRSAIALRPKSVLDLAVAPRHHRQSAHPIRIRNNTAAQSD